MIDKSDDEWKTIGAELGRKGLEALQKWHSKVDAGEAKLRDLYVATDVLFDVMSGLAPWADTDIVGQVSEDIRREVKRMRKERR